MWMAECAVSPSDWPVPIIIDDSAVVIVKWAAHYEHTFTLTP